MNGTFFTLDFKALFFVVLFSLPIIFLWRWRQGFKEPEIAYSDINGLLNSGPRVLMEKWPEKLIWVSLLCFVIAFIDPHLLLERSVNPSDVNPQIPPTEGVAIYLVLDQSGSMKDQVFADTDSGQRLLSKIDLVKQVTIEFIDGDAKLGLRGRPNDMLGLIFFARAARVMSPLTLDHASLLQELSKYSEVGDKDQDGTSLGYAIFKASNLMAATRHYSQELIAKGKPAYTIKNNIIILLTDGLQDPNPLDKGKRLRNMDIPEAATIAKDLGVRLYMVNVDPALGSEEFAPYRHIMQRAAELTGGKFYMVNNAGDLQKIYRDIDQLEKSVLPPPVGLFEKEKRPDLYHRFSFFPSFIILGLICLFSSILLETTILRKVP